MIGRLKDLSFGRNGESILTLSVRSDCGDLFDELQDVDVDIKIKKYRKKRSHNANAYFHVLVNKIAAVQKLGDDEVKELMVERDGALAKDDEGNTIGFKLPETVNVKAIYPYTRCFDTRYENGKTFKCYLCYKHTSDLDTAEMARLIDGVVSEAQELGIETETPEEIAKMKSLWATAPERKSDD